MKNKIKYLPIGILTLTTAVSGVTLSAASVNAATTGTADVTVSVNTACNFTGTTTFANSLIADAGVTLNTESISDATRGIFNVTCNNPNGFYITAIGFSPDASNPSGLEGNTAMYSTKGTINTGTSGTNSFWSFKVSNVTGTNASIVGSAQGDTVNYANYANVPSTDTTIVRYGATSSTDVVNGTIRTDYQIFTSQTQPAGTYTGAVKYKIVENS